MPADDTFTAADAGRHSFVGGVAFYRTGTQTLVALDEASGSVSFFVYDRDDGSVFGDQLDLTV